MEKEPNVIDNLNKLSMPATILIGCVILGGFYYFSQVSKQNSIEKQQEKEASLESAKEAEIKFAKSFCVSEAEETAVNLYKDYCTPANYCEYKEGTFLTSQYEKAYERCLQRKGLD